MKLADMDEVQKLISDLHLVEKCLDDLNNGRFHAWVSGGNQFWALCSPDAKEQVRMLLRQEGMRLQANVLGELMKLGVEFD